MLSFIAILLALAAKFSKISTNSSSIVLINDHTGHYFLSAGWDKTVRAYNLGSFSNYYAPWLWLITTGDPRTKTDRIGKNKILNISDRSGSSTGSPWIASVFENKCKQILRISTFIMMLFVIQPKQFYQLITIHLRDPSTARFALVRPCKKIFDLGNGFCLQFGVD